MAYEEDELKIMFEIDEAKKRFAAAEAELKKNIAGHEAKIRTLRERETQLQAEIKEARGGGGARRGPKCRSPNSGFTTALPSNPGIRSV